MGFIAETARITLAGIAAVALVSLTIYLISRLFPAEPAIYFILWALVAIPATLMVIGAIVGRTAYFACLGPNKSVASSAAIALLSAAGGIALWLLLASGLLGSAGFLGPYLESLNMAGYVELAAVMVMYALAGAIGGIVDYFISRGRKCDIPAGRR
jgi:hypothetical protein